MRYHKSMRRTAAGLGTTFWQVQSRLGGGNSDSDNGDDNQD